MENKDTLGMIFPITKGMLSILKGRDKAVICKFNPQEKIPNYLKKNQKIIFYLSQHLIGEGIISKIELISPLDVLKRYIKNLLVTEREFKEYVGLRSLKKMLLLQLVKIKLYKKGPIPIYPVPMSGRYIHKSEYNLLVKS
jgi:hypothetical protein